MTRFLGLIAVLVVAGCTTYKMWTEADADRDAGLVRLSYEYRKYESPVVDERAGIEMARARCVDWGYKTANRKAEDRVCIDGLKSDCSKWQVTREYRCSK